MLFRYSILLMGALLLATNSSLQGGMANFIPQKIHPKFLEVEEFVQSIAHFHEIAIYGTTCFIGFMLLSTGMCIAYATYTDNRFTYINLMNFICLSQLGIGAGLLRFGIRNIRSFM